MSSICPESFFRNNTQYSHPCPNNGALSYALKSTEIILAKIYM